MPDEPYVDMDAATAAAQRLMDAEASSDEGEAGVEPGTEGQVAAAESPAPEPTESPAAEEKPAAEEEEFLPRADLESLLEGVTDPGAREAITTAYKSFQRGFTQKSQELSGLRRAFEGIDPNQAREAYDFVQNLATDRDFATRVHSELAQALELAGASPAQAEAEATRQVESALAGDLEDFGVSPDNPLVKQVAALEARQADWERREQERVQQAQRDAEIAAIQRQDQKIRRERTDLDDDAMNAVYALGASTGGDLEAAVEIYDALTERIVTDYVARKSAPAGAAAAPPAGATHSEEPVVIQNMDDAGKIAAERIKQIFANQ